MSNTTNNPIRVSELSTGDFVPKVKTLPNTNSIPLPKPIPKNVLSDAMQSISVGTFLELEQLSFANQTEFGHELNIPTDFQKQLEFEPSNAVRLPVPPITSKIWGLEYHSITMNETLDYLEQVIIAKQPSYVVTANLNYAMLCKKHPLLADFTHRAALVLCDGMPILWRSKLNGTKLPERVAGADLIYRLTERCAAKKLSVYFYGAAEGVAERTALQLKKLYPDLIVAGVQCPPFRNCSSEEIQRQIARIKQASPDVLYVALGQPKGEYWIEEHLSELNVPLCIQLGASFDFVAGNAIRAPKVFQNLGLEWFYRTIEDPKRLAPRYLQNFFYLLGAIRRDMIESLS